MPSLWKRDNSPYWVCCYTSADGQRLKKSTKQTDRKRAGKSASRLNAPNVLPRTELSRSRRRKRSLGRLSSARPASLCTITRQRIGSVNGRRAKRKRSQRPRRNVTSRFRGSFSDRSATGQSFRSRTSRPKIFAPIGTRSSRQAKAPKTANLSVEDCERGFQCRFAARLHHEQPMHRAGRAYRKKQRSVPRSRRASDKTGKAAEGDWKGAILLAYYTGHDSATSQTCGGARLT